MTRTEHTTIINVNGQDKLVSIVDTTYTNGRRQLTIWKNDNAARNYRASFHLFDVVDGQVRVTGREPKFAQRAAQAYAGAA